MWTYFMLRWLVIRQYVMIIENYRYALYGRGERPIVQQIFGSDVDSFVGAAKYIEKEMRPDIIDINMGCPVPKVALRAQAGSACLKILVK